MIKNLVIVESPTKAKTIQKYLGNNFQVVSSFGHISDLPEKKLGINIKNNFTPTYLVPNSKKNIVKKLKSLVDNSNIIWLATDEDREGEAISWHLFKELNIPEEKIRRIVFHEITEKSIDKAIKNPRSINYNLVNSQQARRILDRLVGFKLSPILWKKIKTGLSAGRVQSIAVRLIAEKENQIKNFLPKSFYKIFGIFYLKNKYEIKAELEKKFFNKNEMENFLESCIDKKFIISNIVNTINKKSPNPPFTTSTLQQESAKKFNYSIAYTMNIAQQLYEEGYITYTRTDSLNLSKDIIHDIKIYINENYNKNYLCYRKYNTKIKSAQEAHESIRPTDIKKSILDLNNDQKRIYDLIWKRVISSQMSDAILENKKIFIKTPGEYNFIYNLTSIKFNGFLKINSNNKNPKNILELSENINLKKNDKLYIKDIYAIQKFSKYPSRYNEASLVKTLENLGIGRPSTYVPIISVIQKRNYVEIKNSKGIERFYNKISFKMKEKKFIYKKEKEITGLINKKFFLTDTGIIVNDFLVKYFNKILDYGFTAKIEKNFDEIAYGKKSWNNIIQNFYNEFHNRVKYVIKNANITKGERLLGIHPESGEKIWAKLGRFGPMIQIGEKSINSKKPRFVSLFGNKKIGSISLEEALDLLKLPINLGFFKKIEITINVSRYGPYIKYGNNFISIKKEFEDNIFNISLKDSIEIIKNIQKKNSKKIIKHFESENNSIKIINGKYGPYIRENKKNYKIPKDINPSKLTLHDCNNIIKSNSMNKLKK